MAENRIRGTPGNSRPGWWAGCKQPGCIYGQDGNCPDIRRCLKREVWQRTRRHTGGEHSDMMTIPVRRTPLFLSVWTALTSQSGYRASSRSCMAPTNALNPAGIPVIAAYIFSFMLLFLLSCWAQGCPGAYNAGAMPAVSFWCRFKAPLFSACAASGSRP